MEVTVLFEKGLKGELPPGEWVRGVVEKALAAEQSSPLSEVSVLIAGEKTVRELNRDYLGEDRPTDVISFPMLTSDDQTGFVSPPDGLVHLGEIIISLPQAMQQAIEHAHSTNRELAILTIHGVLHLLGRDHAGPEAEREMRQREKEILDSIDLR